MPPAPRALLRILLALLLVSCAAGSPGRRAAPSAVRTPTSVPVAAWFDDYREVLSGTLTVDPVLHTGFLDLQSEVSGIRCVGESRLVLMPPGTGAAGGSCDGVRGAISLGCSDGRSLAGAWQSHGRCGQAYGVGQDADGARFHLVYGMSPIGNGLVVSDALESLHDRPALPPVGDAEGAAARKASTGTGFFVTRSGHVLTAEHVVEGAQQVQVLVGDDLLDARVLARDTNDDLALLEVQAITRPLPVRRTSGLAKGEEVLTLGYPVPVLQGRELKATFGHVNALSGLQGDPRFAQVDVPIQPGNSGGPLLDDEGEVVGVVMGTLDPSLLGQVAGFVPQNVNYALKSERVERFLSRNLPQDALLDDTTERHPSPLEELIAQAEASVVLVIAQ
jgi:S1-C subfamily serine protease